MTTRLTWSEVDARWPGASVMWDRDVAGEGWDPVFVERDGVLWATDPGNDVRLPICNPMSPRIGCRCRAWIPNLNTWWTHSKWLHRERMENSPYWGIDRSVYGHTYSHAWVDEAQHYTRDRIDSVMHVMRHVAMNPTTHSHLGPPRPTLRKTLAALLNAPASTAGTPRQP